jgi:hypothetical protein
MSTTQELQWINIQELLVEAIDIWESDYISDDAISLFYKANQAYRNNEEIFFSTAFLGLQKKLNLSQIKGLFNGYFKEICIKRIALYEYDSEDYNTPIEEIQEAFAFLAILQEEFIKFIKNELKI